MHEHIKVSSEKDRFKKHLRNYRFNSSEVDSCVKRIKCYICFKNRRNNLNATSSKILMCTYGSDFYCFSTCPLELFKLPLAHSLSWLTGQGGGGGLLCSFFETEMNDPG